MSPAAGSVGAEPGPDRGVAVGPGLGPPGRGLMPQDMAGSRPQSQSPELGVTSEPLRIITDVRSGVSQTQPISATATARTRQGCLIVLLGGDC
jgi:hypothetical protein